MNNPLINYVRAFWARSIRRQLMLGITLVHAVLMTIFVFDLVERQRSFSHEQHIKQTASLAETLSANSVSWVLANDIVGLEEIIHSATGYPSLQYAMVLTPEGRVMAHSDNIFNGQYITDTVSQKLLHANIESQYLQTGLALVDVAVPIMANEKFIGWARVAISGEDIAEGLQIISRDGVIYTVIAILVGSLFAFVMARGMTSDMQKLVKVASSVSGGSAERVKIDREDEIGNLAKDFNRMLDSLDRNSRFQRMLEQELRSRRDLLEEQVRERTKELEQARDDALQATVAKSSFLASMSHELRTPLNSIIGFTGIVMDGEAGDLNEEQKKQLGMVYNSSRHLLGLINDILDLSKVESGKQEVSKESFEVKPLLSELYDMMVPLADNKGLKLEVSCIPSCYCESSNEELCSKACPEMLYTDRGKLKQVLINLIGNALKFTEHGSVTISCYVKEDNLQIQVEDTGIGIDEEHLATIFEAFQQVDFGDTRQKEGTGLGLAISHEFMALLGGSLEVKSEPGKGSIFYLNIPIDDNVSVPIKHKVSHTRDNGHSGEKKVILVVDDQADARALIKQYLERDGYDVIMSSHHDDALYQARTHKPFAITLDIMMPEPDGWSILAALKNDAETTSIPVILVTVLDEKNLGLSLGAVDYLQKPVEGPQLLAALNKIHLSGNHILVVDDREQDAELLMTILEPHGYQVQYANSGEVALQAVDEEIPDIILLDLMMPNMSGFEVIRRIRAKDSIARDIPIIVVSAKSLTEAEQEYLQNNVEQVLVKGQFDKQTMLTEVSRLLSTMEQQA